MGGGGDYQKLQKFEQMSEQLSTLQQKMADMQSEYQSFGAQSYGGGMYGTQNGGKRKADMSYSGFSKRGYYS